jgi:hypothetical protein
VPVGLLITAGLVALGMAASLRPPSRSGLPGLATWLVSAIPNESPFLAFYWMVASTLLAFSQNDLHGAPVWVAVALAAAAFVGTPVLVRRSLRAARAIEQALDRGVGPRVATRREVCNRSHQTRRGHGSCWHRCPGSIPASGAFPTSATAKPAAATASISTGFGAAAAAGRY